MQHMASVRQCNIRQLWHPQLRSTFITSCIAVQPGCAALASLVTDHAQHNEYPKSPTSIQGSTAIQDMVTAKPWIHSLASLTGCGCVPVAAAVFCVLPCVLTAGPISPAAAAAAAA